jgi:adenylate kinase family enzyme
MARLHITGASGTGTSTLGAALAERLWLPHIDADAIFWLPTDPPFTTKRPKEPRMRLVQELLPTNGKWVFSGSAPRWTASLEPFYDLIVLLTLDPAIRMERLRRREAKRYGARIAPGGDMASASAQFVDWAAAYDTAGMEQRSRTFHENWLRSQRAPVLRLDSSAPVEDLVQAVLAKLNATYLSKSEHLDRG